MRLSAPLLGAGVGWVLALSACDSAEALDLLPTADAGPASCVVDGDCPQGGKCLYWARAPTTGECAAMCPLCDAGGCHVVCACDGTYRTGCTDFPFSHQQNVNLDGGAGSACIPRPICSP